MVNKSLLTAASILTGTMIGAGFLGIPHVISKSGFIPGVIILGLVAVFILFMKLYLGEVSLRTKGNHQLTGYAEKYLGKAGKYLMLVAMVFGIFSAMIAYLIGEGQSLSILITGGEAYSLVCSLAFWVIMASLAFIGLKALKKYEKIGLILVTIIILAVVIIFAPGIKSENLSYINPESLFMPLGVIMFSFLAFSAMPEVERVLIGREKLMKKAIILGTIIPFFVYLIFSTIIVGNFGPNVPEIATLALGRFFSILGVVTMFTAFFSSSIAIRDMFRFDFQLGRFKGWALAVFVPLLLFIAITFFKLLSFIQLLGVAGVVSGGLTGILVLLMNKKAKKLGNRKPEYKLGINWKIIILLSAIFIAAVILELVF